MYVSYMAHRRDVFNMSCKLLTSSRSTFEISFKRPLVHRRTRHAVCQKQCGLDQRLGHEWTRDHLSGDSVPDSDSEMAAVYPPEFLNSLNQTGLPPFRLHFKVNQSMILLRNIDPKNGLCSGTRLICKVLHPNVIDAAILTGERQGQRVFIPRIPMPTTDTGGDAVQFTRMQFPVRAAFAMSINKAQEQTLCNVSIYSPEPVFTHGNCMWRYRRALRSPGSRSWRRIRP